MHPACDVKGQVVRVVDVALLGPFMIWVGLKAKGIPKAAGTAMVIAGGTTIAFNAVNLWRVHRGKAT